MEHQPVLLEPVLEALNIRADGIYIDATFGRGGHATAILEKLNNSGRLFAIDQDITAVEVANKKLADDKRFSIRHGSFDMLNSFCDDWGITGKVNGVLFDLGVSSPQLDDASRGFSFMRNGPLDMRMDVSKGLTAAEWLSQAEETEIADVIWRYGEERHSRRIARKIIEVRQITPIIETTQLAQIVKEASAKKDAHKHPATRTFQAIRIHLNRELEVLEPVLTQSLDVLALHGRLVVISFHSLEDRIVKLFMREQAVGKTLPRLPRGFPIQPEAHKPTINVLKKIMASQSEIKNNVRARSAVLRVAEKLA